MSWVMSTCMACTGVGLASSSPRSRSGAPTRARPRTGSIVVAMLVLLAGKVYKEAERGVKLAPGCC